MPSVADVIAAARGGSSQSSTPSPQVTSTQQPTQPQTGGTPSVSDVLAAAHGQTSSYQPPAPSSTFTVQPSLKDKLFTSLGRIGQVLKINTPSFVAGMQEGAGTVLKNMALNEPVDVNDVNSRYASQNIEVRNLENQLKNTTDPTRSKELIDQINQLKDFQTNLGKREDTAGGNLITTGAATNKQVTQNQQTFEDKNGKATGFQWLAEEVAKAAPGTLGVLVPSTLATVATGDPVVGLAVGLPMNYLQGAGSFYQTAKDYGVSEEKALNLANVGGAVQAFLQLIPLHQLLGNEAKTLAPAIEKNILKVIATDMVKQGVLGGAAAGLQQLVTNAIVKLSYNPNQSLTEGVPQAAAVGGVTGALVSGSMESENAVLGKLVDQFGVQKLTTPEKGAQVLDPKVLDTATQKTKEAVATPAESRTPEQNQIVAALSTRELTPSQAIQFVNENKLQDTPEGQEIVKAAGQAQQSGKNIQIKGSETSNNVTVAQVEKSDFSNMQDLIAQKKTQLGMQSEVKASPVGPEENKAVPEQKLPYEPNTALPDDQKAIETKFGQYLNDHLDEAVAQYKEKFGNVINTDNVRELSPEYVKDRTQLSAAVHQPASAFSRYLYEQALKETPAEGQHNEVLFTAGGTGAGKSTAINTSPEFKNSADEAQIVYDTNLAGYGSSKEKIDQALAAGKDVQILYVLRDPQDSLVNGVIPRAADNGRAVPLDAHVDAHVKSLETIKKLIGDYANDPHVDITVLDNNNGKGNPSILPIEDLHKISYNADEIRNNGQQTLEDLHNSGKLSDSIYQGITGKQGVSPESTTASADGNQQPQVGQDLNPKANLNSDQKPLGTGDVVNSKMLDRVKEQLLTVDAGKYEFNPETGTHNTLNLQQDAQKAVDFMTSDPKGAIRAALGLDATPEGITQNALGLAVAFKARDEGNYQLYEQTLNKVMRQSSRFGQEIVTLRGKFSDDTPENYIKQIVDQRIGKLSDTLLTGEEKAALKESKAKSPADIVNKKISEQADELAKTVKDTQGKIKMAQDIIDSLRC